MKKFLLTLFLPSLLFAQTAIYRSIQPGNTSAIATNAIGNLTISGSTATFSAALPDTIGIGCVIQYDANNDATVDNLAFIHGRTSSTVFTVKDSLGAEPNAVTGDDAWSIFHAYIHHSNWEAGTENTGIDAALRNFDPGNRNIATANEQWFVCLYRGTLVGTTQTIINWTTGAPGTNNKINIFPPRTTSEVGVSQFHNGNFAGGYRVIYTGGTVTQAVISIDVRNLVLDGIVMHDSSTGGSTVTLIFTLPGTGVTTDVKVKNSIFKGHVGAPGIGTIVETTGNLAIVYVSNCYFFRAKGGSGYGINVANTTTLYAHNNSFYDCTTNGIRRASGTVHIRNNLVTDTATSDFSGTFSTSEYNASQDATASGTGSRTNQTFSFVAPNSGNLALTSSDAGAKDFGTDLSGDANLSITDDIIGTVRPQGSAYDIGAFEFVQTGGRRRWIVQSLFPENFIYVVTIISIFGIGVGIYKTVWEKKKLREAWKKSRKTN